MSNGGGSVVGIILPLAFIGIALGTTQRIVKHTNQSLRGRTSRRRRKASGIF